VPPRGIFFMPSGNSGNHTRHLKEFFQTTLKNSETGRDLSASFSAFNGMRSTFYYYFQAFLSAFGETSNLSL